MSLAGQVAVITGGSRGIGRAVAERFLERGARVALIARDTDRLQQTCDALGEQHPNAELLGLAADVGEEDSVTDALARVRERLGPVEVLVNNAGIVRRSTVNHHPTDDWDAVLRVNLRGAFLCAREVLPGMLEQGRGRIVNVSSISGTLGTPGLSAYCASKWGLLGLTKALAEEVREQGILVAAVCPGSVDTEMLRQGVPGLEPDMSPAEVAGTILYLAQDAPLAMTGSAMEIFG